MIGFKKLKIKIIKRKKKGRRKKKGEKKENSTELQKPDGEAQVYNNKNMTEEKKKAQKLN